MFVLITTLLLLSPILQHTRENAITKFSQGTEKPALKLQGTLSNECSKQDLMTLKQCCKSPPRDLIDFSKMTVCKALLSSRKESICYRDFNHIQTSGYSDQLGSNKFITNDEADYAKANSYIMTKQLGNSSWKEIVAKASYYQPSVETYTLQTVPMEKTNLKSCITAPGLIMQCLTRSILTVCPFLNILSTLQLLWTPAFFFYFNEKIGY